MQPPRLEPVSGALASLLATEERLERRLAEARAEGGRLLADAQEAARAGEAGLEADLAELGRRLETAAGAERAARLREIEAAANAEIAAFDDVSPERIAELARYVTSCVVAGEIP